MNATIGQYSDFISFSDLAFDCGIGGWCYCCGQTAKWAGGLGSILPDGTNPNLCDGCHFRHTVMKAAGREDEFWAAHKDNPVRDVQNELAYRMAKSLNAMVLATAEASLSGK